MKNPWQISNIDFIISYVAGGIAYPKVAHSKEEIINGLEYAVSLGKRIMLIILIFVLLQ